MSNTALRVKQKSFLPVLEETAQNSAHISVAIVTASFSVFCLSSEGLMQETGLESCHRSQCETNTSQILLIDLQGGRSLYQPGR